MANDVEILGLKELGDSIDQLTQKAQKRSIRNAVRAGARVYRDGMKQRVAKASGDLSDNITAKDAPTADGGFEALVGIKYRGLKAKSSRRKRAIRVDEFGRVRNWVNQFGVFKSDEMAAPSSEDPAVYAQFLEFGRPGKKGHTHQAAQPFIRPTFDQDTQKAEQAIADRLEAEIIRGEG